ncbi:nitrite reductase small subunit NirD [Paenibacillus chibensis]|uniref:nitrite reductase small subunit NirD n=1 Tax=Paenibacillus chibensis TaxID=59846 RepID=UPI000FD8C1B8|nr:nitrite reductase small subunit NirD [Paenibacillus chibensis]MEC0371937.1 nitrite reductase small subunit NirD [Paenibacillus chibensis]
MENVLSYYPAGTLEDYGAQMGRVVHIGELELAVFHTSTGEMYALDNRSPHPKGGPLAEGIISGHFVYDPLYDWKIDLKEGQVQSPDHGQVRTYPVLVEDGTVKIGIPSESVHTGGSR